MTSLLPQCSNLADNVNSLLDLLAQEANLTTETTAIEASLKKAYEIISELNLSYQKGHRADRKCRQKSTKTICGTTKKNCKIRIKTRKLSFLMNLPFTIAQVFSMGGQKKTLDQIFLVMKRESVTKLMDY